MVDAIMSCFTLSKPCLHNSPLNLSHFDVTNNAAPKLLRQCSTSKFGYGLRGHCVEKIERGSNAKVNAFPDWPLMAVLVEHIPGQRDLITHKSIWHLSDNAIKNVYTFYIMFTVWGCCFFGAAKDPFYDSEQYRKDGGDGTGYWVYEKAQASICVSKAMRWWDQTLKPNMVEIHSASEFVTALKTADDRLVIVDFYSPGCGGCKSLHPKVCQLAESNPDAIFLKVNYEELKPMCHALHIHVLPFFRFYRGADGRVCSFSCTISTVKKFKDALAKHGTERCSIGPAKGLDESELLNLASIGELSMNSRKPSLIKEGSMEEIVLGSIGISNPLNLAGNNAMLLA